MSICLARKLSSLHPLRLFVTERKILWKVNLDIDTKLFFESLITLMSSERFKMSKGNHLTLWACFLHTKYKHGPNEKNKPTFALDRVTFHTYDTVH